MTKPTHIAVCIPCGPGHTLHITHALAMYARQTLPHDRFEVVVCFDDHAGTGVPDYPWLTKVNYRRDASVASLPHRNHCRNTAANAASDKATHFWFVDADVMPDSDLLRQATELFDRRPNTHSLAIHPVIWCFSKADSLRWLGSPPTEALLHSIPRRDWLQPLTGYRAAPNKTPTIESHTQLSRNTEGYPCLSREVFDLLDGFDQTYLGWGHNKEAFVLKLQALDAVCPYRLLTSCAGYRLTHDQDPTAVGHKKHTPLTHNSRMFNALRASRGAWGPELVEKWRVLCGS